MRIVRLTLFAIAVGLGAGGGLSHSTASAANMPMTVDDVPIRPYADGSGPTAIFRLGRIESRHEDIFGVVDPIRWRIQYYTLSDWALDPGNAPFRERWKAAGSCRLSPRFRVWRVHTFPQSVILQSQPVVPPETFLFVRGAHPAKLSFRKVTLVNDPSSLQVIADASPTPDDQIPETACAPGVAGDGSQVFAESDAEADVAGGQTAPFTVQRHAAANMTAFDRTKVSLFYRGRYLSSAQELEEGVTVRSNQPIRHFLVTTRTNFPGFVSTETLLFRRGEKGQSAGAMVINLGLNRVKLGQRPVAVSSKGEVLVLGAPDHGGFRVHRCTYLIQPGVTSQCKVEEADGGRSTSPKAEPRDPDGARLRDAPMWRTAFDYSEREFTLDPSTLPTKDCQHLVGKCVVDGIAWTPLPELRGGQPGLVVRKGFPYGQVSGDNRPPTPKSSASDPSLSRPGGGAMSAAAMDGSKLVVFGDINNDGPILDPERTRVFGIDCSTFLALLWNLPGHWDTGGFIKAANKGSREIRRVAELGQAVIGDAFVINIAEDAEHKYINHIVLYREARDAGPTDKSQAILVVESNGSCAGVCWSFYDESFLNGWGILRHDSAPANLGALTPIPTLGTEWRKNFAN